MLSYLKHSQWARTMILLWWPRRWKLCVRPDDPVICVDTGQLIEMDCRAFIFYEICSTSVNLKYIFYVYRSRKYLMLIDERSFKLAIFYLIIVCWFLKVLFLRKLISVIQITRITNVILLFIFFQAPRFGFKFTLTYCCVSFLNKKIGT